MDLTATNGAAASRNHAGRSGEQDEVTQWLLADEVVAPSNGHRNGNGNGDGNGHGANGAVVAQPDGFAVSPRQSRKRRKIRERRRNAARLRKALNRLESRERAVAQLEARVAELERELADARGDEAAPAPRKRPRRNGATRGKDLNTVTFDELRGLGLTVNQSASVIAAREVRQRFDSVEEVAEIRGLSNKAVSLLVSSLRV